ncbi:uncharacterized protein LOC116613951 isoform X2 [Nematostella vectensis]|uniref:uncharacterized protein LOC116613951 isoform X2 n=1 Tax=Nematostella vectensis TaxID=45351 RepID=UPI0020772CDB|nr:uncharacterized protein LOC116613951 isoform X2 [Nematostella vectensis]
MSEENELKMRRESSEKDDSDVHDEKESDADKQLSVPYHHIPALSKSRVFFLNISWFGLNVMYLILSVEVVPSQVHALVGSENKGQVLGGMVAAGAVVTFFISPLIGMKSDRLVSPYGKRRPLMVAGSLLLCIGLFGMAFSAPDIESDSSNATCSMDLAFKRCIPYMNMSQFQHRGNMSEFADDIESSFLLDILMQREDSRGNVGLYIAFYLCVMACYAVMNVPYNGLIADQTPPSQRGFSSGVMGAMTLVGNVTGAGIGLFFPRLGVVGTYGLIAILYFVCVILTVVSCPETPGKTTHQPLSVKMIFLAYWEPLKERDFRWVFLTRFLMQQGVATVTGFLEFWLGDMVTLPNCWPPERGVAMLLLPLLFAAAIFSVVGGFLSDKLRRRKPLVLGSAILMSICAVILAGLQGKYAFYAAIPVSLTFGIGFGAYCAVDFALVMDVLPDEKDKAKDLAIWHQALVLPQAIATPVGGIIIDMFEKWRCDIGLGYIILFLVTSSYFALSGVFVMKIKNAS